MENRGVPQWSVGQRVLRETSGSFVQHLQHNYETKRGLPFTFGLLLNLSEADIIRRSAYRAEQAAKRANKYLRR